MKKYGLLLIGCLFHLITKAQTSDTVTNKINNVPYRQFDVFAKFTDGDIYDYVSKNIKYPPALNKAINEKIVTSMVINKDGDVIDVKILKNIAPAIDDEIIRVLQSSPKWTAASYKGDKVNLNIVLLINIKADPTTKAIEATKYKYEPSSTIANENTVYVAVQTPPSYSGGQDAFDRFLDKNINYPAGALKNRVSGKVILSFVVEKDGHLTTFNIYRSPSEDLTNECIRALKSCIYNPGLQNGKAVRVEYSTSINFDLDNPNIHHEVHKSLR